MYAYAAVSARRNSYFKSEDAEEICRCMSESKLAS